VPPTATPTRTNTPLPPTATPTNGPNFSDGQFLFSLGSSATLSGIVFQDEDIVAWNGSAFSTFFDGSDVGLTRALIDGFAVIGARDVLLTFAAPGSIGSLVYDDSDILHFRASSLGDSTAGTWSMYFDGSDVGLLYDTEDVDGLEMLPNGTLLLSTQGDFSVPGVSGDDKDILKFSPTMAGLTTSGFFELYFDGSDVGLTRDSEDIDGLAIAGSGSLYLSTAGEFDVPGLSGQDEDVFVFSPAGLGVNTAGNFVPLLFFDGSAYGLSNNDIVDIDLP
jgi:hypothetical protein